MTGLVSTDYGIKVSFAFGGSRTLKIVIYCTENHPHRPILRLDDYHPLGGWEVLISGQYICTYHMFAYTYEYAYRCGKQRP